MLFIPLFTPMFRNNPLLKSHQNWKYYTPLAFEIKPQQQPNNPKDPTQRQRYANKMLDSCSSKLDGEVFPRTVDFGQSNNIFYGISVSFKYTFCLAPRWKLNWPRWISLFLYFPAEIFQFSLNPRCKMGWPQGHLDRV